MEFKKYQHVERFGTTEVDKIEFGKVYVFPKIDGTNGSIWFKEPWVCAGSRNRTLTIDNDNAGFYNWAIDQKNITSFFLDHPELRLFGEWLVPHSLKTYKENAWRKFYVFDVAVDKLESEIIHDSDDKIKYLSYDEYKPLLEKYSIDYIAPICTITNGNYEQFVNQLAKNVFLIEDGKGAGEGIVLKNYDYKNKYGRQTWAKIVTSEFKEKHSKVMGESEIKGKKMIEEEISNKYITKALCEKIFAKIEVENQGFSSRNIPQLLNTIFYDLIKEESWNFVKGFKNPIINYKTLQHFVFNKAKENLPQLF